MHSGILMSTYCIPTVLVAVDTLVNRTQDIPALMALTHLLSKQNFFHLVISTMGKMQISVLQK